MIEKTLKSIHERLMSRVKAMPSGCLEWQGTKTRGGYGSISINSVDTPTHRAMYEALNGKIPSGMFVCHTCDNPPCINPEHLFLGTAKDNMQDSIVKGRFKFNFKKGNKITLGRAPENRALTEQDVKEVRKKLSSGERVCDIAKLYGVTRYVIGDINRRKTYQNV